MPEPLERLFLREKPVSAILAVAEIDQAYAALVAKRIDSTVSHTCSILDQMEEEGLIVSRPVGRINRLELTERGKSLVHTLRELLEILEKPDVMRVRLERFRLMATGTDVKTGPLILGPLRRDLARIIAQSDGKLQNDAREIDGIISSLVND
ncbi:MAG: hypothetical protein ACP5OU_09255 [Methanothrix sp.]